MNVLYNKSNIKSWLTENYIETIRFRVFGKIVKKGGGDTYGFKKNWVPAELQTMDSPLNVIVNETDILNFDTF